MHPRNAHKQGYDFAALCASYPLLTPFLCISTKGKQSIDFANPQAVKCLNAALLAHHYGIDVWDIPKGYLCPAVPGRADYVHYIADLLHQSPGTTNAKDKKIKGVDIGTGANLIYPIVGSKVYGWDFVASDIDQTSFQSARNIALANSALKKHVKVKLQSNKSHYFAGVVGSAKFDFSMCNPPFHSSSQQAIDGNKRKLKGLKHNQSKRSKTDSNVTAARVSNQALNFGGQSNELWCQGGELLFVTNMIKESVNFAEQIRWFTCLISKQANVAPLVKLAEKHQAREIKTVPMGQGNKTSRFIAWTY